MAVTPQERRRYDSAGRQRQAAATRAVIVTTAGQLFVERGYANTSIADVAAAAGVSPRTVFGSFGSKPQLLKQALDAAIVGDADPVPLHERPGMRRFHAATTFAAACDHLADVFAEVAPRTYAIFNVVHRAADADPQIAALERELDASRLTGVGYLAVTFARLLDVSDPAAEQQIRDTLWLLGSPLQYGLLVHDRGWSVAAYRAWMAAALSTLLPASVPAGGAP